MYSQAAHHGPRRGRNNDQSTEHSNRFAGKSRNNNVRVYIPDENRKREPRTELAIINRAQRCATRVLLTDMVGAKKKERDREKKREEENSRGRRTRGSLRALGVGQGFIGYVNAAKLRGSHPRDTVVHLKRMIFLHVRRVVTRKEQFRQAAISV